MIHMLYECGICENLHPCYWDGDCRDDDNRYSSPEDYSKEYNISLEEIIVYESYDDFIFNNDHEPDYEEYSEMD